jgi:cyclophilin family peptidyl-prolyl cis-trans isomerase
MMKQFFFLAALCCVLLSCKEENIDLPDGLYAQIQTSKGEIICKLEYEKSPVTVANFVTLAEGKSPFVVDKYKGKPFYDGLTFHRVVANFMVQGGDPDSNGSGGPGYRFKDEFSDLKFDKPGVLAMANAGPGTNGSQFFITHVATQYLEGKHTIFGEVVGRGMETVNTIENGDVITTIKIIRKGEAAKRFDALKIFNDYVTSDLENRKKQEALDSENRQLYEQKYQAIIDKKAAEMRALKSRSEKLKSGLQYTILTAGNGKRPTPGSPILISYAGYLESGKMIDTNVAELAKANGLYNQQEEAMGVYQPLRLVAGQYKNMFPGFGQAIGKLTVGEKAIFFIPAVLAYGPQGAGDVIPPNANLIFEIELKQ